MMHAFSMPIFLALPVPLPDLSNTTTVWSSFLIGKLSKSTIEVSLMSSTTTICKSFLLGIEATHLTNKAGVFL